MSDSHAIQGPPSRLMHGHCTGRRFSPTYHSWASMMTRCCNPNAKTFARYGGAGVAVYPEWRDSFEAFLRDVGERPSKAHSLDRFPDRFGGYFPGNVRWATRKEQCRNRRNTRAVLRSDGMRFPSIIDAAEAVAGNRRQVRDCLIGRQKTHMGWGWAYAD